MKRSFSISAILTVVFIAVLLFSHHLSARATGRPAERNLAIHRSVSDVIRQYGEGAEARLVQAFSQAGVAYPPTRVALLGLKAERALEVWAFEGNDWHFVTKYPIRAASGTAGPKLRQGDRQVPEGVYRITWLNPNSSFHLSMKLDYPNAFDLQQARREGRQKPGNDIFIHGNSVSIGCLAMGDRAIEDLFILTDAVGKKNIRVVIAPHDPRRAPLPRSLPNGPTWLPELYEQIEKEFSAFGGEKPRRGPLEDGSYVGDEIGRGLSATLPGESG
jgi:hypothetical protein